MVESNGSVHVGPFLLIVTGGLHHVLGVTEQSQVHQLVIQTILLHTHIKMSGYKQASCVILHDSFDFFPGHLTKPNGIVISLGSSVEVDSLFDVIMALVVPGQMV